MRDVKRIDRILDLIRSVWIEVPDWRLGQLLANIAEADCRTSSDLFYYEDDRLEVMLETFVELYKSVKENR